jgi:2-oxoglutarate ferredoxin oxidoreductase subunit beta
LLGNFEPGTVQEVRLHDGSAILLKKIDRDYDPTDQSNALDLLTESYKNHYFATGLIYINASKPTIHDLYDLPEEALNRLTPERLRPSTALLDEINSSLY